MTSSDSADSSAYDRVLAFVEGRSFDLAVVALRSYFGSDNHYTGAAFDRLAAGSPPGRFTAEDIVAVSMLSVNVPPRAALWLLDSDEANDLLVDVPAGATLWDSPELLDRDSGAWRLWEAVANQRKVGRTIASKILAAKRPGLLPVYDQHVDRALCFGSSYWAFWQEVARHDGAVDLADRVRQAIADAGAPINLHVLRAIDIIVWMRAHGWTTHSKTCALGCDFTGFRPAGA